MSELTFYSNPQSRGRMVHWMLEEVGEPYDTVMVPFGPEMKAPAYCAINPMGKVPALRIGGEVVTEVAAIITTLAFCGDSFSAADVYLGSQIGWGLRAGTMEARPAFTGYWSRTSQRPALARSSALNDALLPKG